MEADTLRVSNALIDVEIVIEFRVDFVVDQNVLNVIEKTVVNVRRNAVLAEEFFARHMQNGNLERNKLSVRSARRNALVVNPTRFINI